VTTVRILSIDGDRVKIGIDAPTSIAVLREELLTQVAGENREAARPSGQAPHVAREFRNFTRRRPQANDGQAPEAPQDAASK
jgi:carbon storage regulator CsrA